MIRTKGTKAILVVDDNEDLRRAAVALLSQLGYNVTEAKDGPSALKVLGQDGKGVDLVFSDVYMPPGMDGFELAQELHRRYPHIKTLLTSGFPGMFLNRDGIDGTGFTVLRKPYMRADLAEAVRAALDHRQPNCQV
jgi:CheY-like chemotaxis protein